MKYLIKTCFVHRRSPFSRETFECVLLRWNLYCPPPRRHQGSDRRGPGDLRHRDHHVRDTGVRVRGGQSVQPQSLVEGEVAAGGAGRRTLHQESQQQDGQSCSQSRHSTEVDSDGNTNSEQSYGILEPHKLAQLRSVCRQGKHATLQDGYCQAV